MNEDPPPSPVAWQPLTFSGVAAFAHAKTSRLWLVQLGVAVLVAVSVLIFLNQTWCPTITAAIHALPDTGQIRGRQLEWFGDDPVILHESPFLAIIVDTADSGATGQIADLQLELGRGELRFVALLGALGVPYPDGWEIAVNRPELEPWWGAWAPMLRAAVALLTLISLFVVWTLLAFLYAPVARLIVFFADRDAGWRDCWRLAGAALMPGALLMSCAIVLYSAGQLTLIHLAFAQVLHLVVGWIYLLGAPFGLSRALPPVLAKVNPFVPPAESPPPAAG